MESAGKAVDRLVFAATVTRSNRHPPGYRNPLTGWTSQDGHHVHPGPFIAIAAGGLQKGLVPGYPHILALQPDGAAVGWGAHGHGELIPPAVRFKAPSPPGLGSTWASMRPGISTTGALRDRFRRSPASLAVRALGYGPMSLRDAVRRSEPPPATRRPWQRTTCHHPPNHRRSGGK